MIPFITNENASGVRSLSVFVDNKMYPVSDSNPLYSRLVVALENDDLDTVREIVAIKANIVKKSFGKLELINDVVYSDGREINNSIIPRIVSMLGQGFKVSHMLNFLNNLLENPSKSAVEELYSFLESCSLPITDDGHFLAYKIVKNDWTDIRTGTFDNSIGSRVTMPRNECDEDSTRHCSTGLHACSQTYLPNYGGFYGRNSEGHVVVVKINPRDVVAVPEKYKYAKVRVCEYLVIDEVFGLDTIEDDFADTSNMIGATGDNYDVEDTCECDCVSDTNDEVYGLNNDTSEPSPVKTPTPTRTRITATEAFEIHSQRADGWTLEGIANVGTLPDKNLSVRQVRRVLSGELHPDVKVKYEDTH